VFQRVQGRVCTVQQSLIFPEKNKLKERKKEKKKIYFVNNSVHENHGLLEYYIMPRQESRGKNQLSLRLQTVKL
jgi:hypothetical protein